MVIFGVCLLLGENADDWNKARQVVASPDFLQMLINLDKNAVPEKVINTGSENDCSLAITNRVLCLEKTSVD